MVDERRPPQRASGSVLAKLRGTASDRVDADQLTWRIDALRRFFKAISERVPEERLAAARDVLTRAGERLELSRDHTVVALAGVTGGGKSSLFNALSRLDLSAVGYRRPTTAVAQACIWHPDGAGRLLDWLGIPQRHQIVRESALDGEDEAPLRGLVLLDLPDFDSVEASHRIEADRLAGLSDLVIWVLDPQKYADAVVHNRYFRQLTSFRDVTVVVLNQVDRLSPDDAARCLEDVRRLLVADGLAGVRVYATSAVTGQGIRELRELLVKTVAARKATLQRLSGDLDTAVASLVDLVGPEAVEESVDRSAVNTLAGALADAAGVGAVASAVARAYRHRALQATGWPFTRWLRRLRPDPLRRLHLGRQPASGEGQPDSAAPVPRSSLPPATPVQRSQVDLAVRALAGGASTGLPELWQRAVLDAARSRADDLPDALDRAIVTTHHGMDRRPAWWRVVGALQWLFALATFVGLVWLGARLVTGAFGLPDILTPKVGAVPVATVLLLLGILLGWLLAWLVRPLIAMGARRRRTRAERRLRAAVGTVVRELVMTPVRAELHRYADARAALAAGTRRSS